MATTSIATIAAAPQSLAQERAIESLLAQSYGSAVPNMSNVNDLWLMYKSLGKGSGTGTDKLKADAVKKTIEEELKYFGIAATLLNPEIKGTDKADVVAAGKAERFRMIAGGRSAQNVANLAALLKREYEKSASEELLQESLKTFKDDLRGYGAFS